MLNNRLKEGVKAGGYWKRHQEAINNTSGEGEKKLIQDMEGKPIMMGCDVVSLYPNLEPVAVAQLTADAVMNTKVQFKGVNFYFLLIYLVIVLGKNQMIKLGLADYVPIYKEKEGQSQSLAAKNNRNTENWDFSHIMMKEEDKKRLIAYVIQIMILLMTTTTCYTFGGNLYRQQGGLGIGLRGSAALARLIMCAWDKEWGSRQCRLGLIVQLFCRYIDDIRLYLRPILPGWKWEAGKWLFTDAPDDSTPAERTVRELNKCLNDGWDFLTFTMEQEEDFTDGFLPTLDFSTKVLENGYIQYKFFRKEMATNQVLQAGTALSKSCVFSSLRQDLVRRLLNTNISLGIEFRLSLVEEYIQLLINSGHKFTFIKSIVLQALTKYTYMVSRSKLDQHDKRYAPLHRTRSYQADERKLLKYTEGAVWYKEYRLGDKYKDQWKNWVRKGSKFRGKTKGKSMNLRTTSVVFVPKTKGGALADKIKEKEDELSHDFGWRLKILEKPGQPLLNTFGKQFKMKYGCYRGESCICKNKGTNCRQKRVVYSACCTTCPEDTSAIYIGETARQLGTRAGEHFDNLKLLKKDSFMVHHWMESHHLDTSPPVFKFKTVSQHKDALSRQIKEAVCIREFGDLNKKNEYALNELIQLESTRYTWDQAVLDKQNNKVKSETDTKVNDFVKVMENVLNIKKVANIEVFNGHYSYRLKLPKRKKGEGTVTAKRQKMDASTPIAFRQFRQEDSSPDSSPINKLEVEEESYTDSSSGGDARTNVSKEVAVMKVDSNPSVETLVERVAGEVVTMDSYTDAKDSYKSRIFLNPELLELDNICNISWEKDVVFDDGDLGLCWLFKEDNVIIKPPRVASDDSMWDGQSDLNLRWLFKLDKGDEMDPFKDGFNLEWLFISEEETFEDDNIDERELAEAIAEKKKNTLYGIFIKTPKRKRSPQEEDSTTAKLRRLTISSTPGASPRLRAVTRSRSLSSCYKKKTNNIMGAKEPRQTLISQLWGKYSRLVDEEADARGAQVLDKE